MADIDYTCDAHKLAEMLKTLPEGSRAGCNAVGNIMITLDDEYMGWISVRGHGPELELLEEDDEDR